MNELVPAPTITVPHPAFEAEVDRRGWKLCAAAEPHAVDGPCVLHLSEARRQLFDAYQRGLSRDEVA